MKKTYNLYLSFVVALSIFASININPNQFGSWQDKQYILFEVITNFIRFFLPTILLVIYSIKLYLDRESMSNERTKPSIYYFLTLISYLLIILSSTGITEKDFSGFENLYIFNYFNIFFFIFLIKRFFSYKVIFLHLIFALLVYFLVVLLSAAYDLTTNYQNIFMLLDYIFNLRGASYFQLNAYSLLGNASIRSTGFSRIVLILWIIVLYYQFKYNNNKKILYIIGFIFSFLIISLQSKFSSISFLIAFLFFLITIKVTIKNLLLIVSLNLFLPIIFYIVAMNGLGKYKTNIKLNEVVLTCTDSKDDKLTKSRYGADTFRNQDRGCADRKLIIVNDELNDTYEKQSRVQSRLKKTVEKVTSQKIEAGTIDSLLEKIPDTKIELKIGLKNTVDKSTKNPNLFLGEANKESYITYVDEFIELIEIVTVAKDNNELDKEEIKVTNSLIVAHENYMAGVINESEFSNEIEDILVINSTAHEMTTGRSTIWLKQIEYIKNNNYLILGKGVMADLKIFNITASNTFIYSWLSGGIFSSIIYLCIIFIFLFKSLSYIIKNFRKNEKNDKILVFCIAGIFFLRSLVENSFMSINYDLIIVLFIFELMNSKSQFFLNFKIKLLNNKYLKI